MVAIWLPATNHCRLEQIPGLSFLACCDHEDSAPHQDNDCETDNCAAVEEGLYKTEDCQITIRAPVFDRSFISACLAEIPSQERQPVVNLLTTATRTLPTSWQFHFRAAAPPRAPSIAS